MRDAEYWKKLLPVIQAFTEGKTVQYKVGGVWSDMWAHGSVSFDHGADNYRIKPEPEIVYVNIYLGGLGHCYKYKDSAVDAAAASALEVAVPFIRMEDSSDA